MALTDAQWAAAVTDIVDRMIAGTITEAQAAQEWALVTSQWTVSASNILELSERVSRFLAKLNGLIVMDGPPDPGVGDLNTWYMNRLKGDFYGPKKASGWGDIAFSLVGPAGASAKQIVINAGLLPEGATDAQFATWLADAQIAKVQPLVDAAGAARDDARQALTDTEALADQIIEDSTPDITVTAVAGAPGTPASVVKGGTLKAPTFEVTVPRGSDGTDGVTPNVSAEVTLVATGQPAVVTRSGPDSAPVFTFQLPRQADGEDGREVEIQAGATHLQWRYAGDTTWINLYAKAELQVKGDKGDAFEFDAKPANLAGRAAYDAEPEGFTVLVMDTGTVYARIGTTPGVWSDGFPFGQTQNAILVALSELSAAPGLLYQEDGESFSKRAIGAAADTDVLDRQSADGRYRRQGQSVAMGDVTGLAGALDEKANAAAVLAALGGKQDKLGFTPADAADTYTKDEVDAAFDALPDPPAVPTFATVAEVRAGKTAGKIIDPQTMADALAPVLLTRTQAAAAMDFDTFIQVSVILDGNLTLAAPTNGAPGKTGQIILAQDATGGRTVAFPSGYRLPSGGISLQATANGVTRIGFMVGAAGVVHLYPPVKWA